MEFVWLYSKIFVFKNFLPCPKIPCWIAVWSLWALQKCLNWNLIFFHLSHYEQIESPAAVLWRGPQSRPLFRLQFDSFWKMSHFVVVMHCQALEPYMLWHRHQLWSFCWPSLQSWASPLAQPVSWCQRDILSLKSLMCSSSLDLVPSPRDTAAGESKWMMYSRTGNGNSELFGIFEQNKIVHLSCWTWQLHNVTDT